MADQRRWFKVWTSITVNAHFAEMSLEDIGRWTLLGAATALDGDRGRLVVPGEGRGLCRLLRVDSFEDAKTALLRLHSVTIDEGRNRHDAAVVTWRNWHKYQADATQAERQKTSRSKRRGEEKRGEERRISTPPTEVLSGSAARPDGLFETASPNGSEDPAARVLAFLNSQTGRHYRPVKINLAMIRARMKEGITEVQLKAIITRKVAKWQGDAKMDEYLRPATLFNRTNCEQYRGELP